MWVAKCPTENNESNLYGKGKICTRGHNEMACHGDSGAPLMLYKADKKGPWVRAYQIGVLITGTGNCTAGNLLSNTFTKTTAFITWILNHIEP